MLRLEKGREAPPHDGMGDALLKSGGEGGTTTILTNALRSKGTQPHDNLVRATKCEGVGKRKGRDFKPGF
jgi:hypothetical protein